MKNEELKNYRKFMSDPKNSHNCENCPENRSFSDWQRRLPCGQQVCWVDSHTKDRVGTY